MEDKMPGVGSGGDSAIQTESCGGPSSSGRKHHHQYHHHHHHHHHHHQTHPSPEKKEAIVTTVTTMDSEALGTRSGGSGGVVIPSDTGSPLSHHQQHQQQTQDADAGGHAARPTLGAGMSTSVMVEEDEEDEQGVGNTLGRGGSVESCGAHRSSSSSSSASGIDSHAKDQPPSLVALAPRPSPRRNGSKQEKLDSRAIGTIGTTGHVQKCTTPEQQQMQMDDRSALEDGDGGTTIIDATTLGNSATCNESHCGEMPESDGDDSSGSSQEAAVKILAGLLTTTEIFTGTAQVGLAALKSIYRKAIELKEGCASPEKLKLLEDILQTVLDAERRIESECDAAIDEADEVEEMLIDEHRVLSRAEVHDEAKRMKDQALALRTQTEQKVGVDDHQQRGSIEPTPTRRPRGRDADKSAHVTDDEEESTAESEEDSSVDGSADCSFYDDDAVGDTKSMKEEIGSLKAKLKVAQLEKARIEKKANKSVDQIRAEKDRALAKKEQEHQERLKKVEETAKAQLEAARKERASDEDRARMEKELDKLQEKVAEQKKRERALKLKHKEELAKIREEKEKASAGSALSKIDGGGQDEDSSNTGNDDEEEEVDGDTGTPTGTDADGNVLRRDSALARFSGLIRAEEAKLETATKNGDDVSEFQKNIANLNKGITLLSKVIERIEKCRTADSWGTLVYGELEQTTNLAEIAKVGDEDTRPIEIVPGVVGKIGVLQIPLLKAFSLSLKRAVATNVATTLDRASILIALFDPHLKAISAENERKGEELTEAQEVVDRLEQQKKEIERDNFGVKPTLLHLVEHGDDVLQSSDETDTVMALSESGDEDEDEDDDDPEEDANEGPTLREIHDVVWPMAEEAGAANLRFGDSANNVLKLCAALIAVLRSMQLVTLGSLTMEEKRKNYVDGFATSIVGQTFDESCTLSHICDECITILSESTTLPEMALKALRCLWAIFTTITSPSKNRPFRMAMAVVSRKAATESTSLDEVAGLHDVDDIFKSESGKTVLSDMVRCASMIVMSQFMFDTIQNNFGEHIADLDLFFICMRLSKSSLAKASKILWTSGIFERETMPVSKAMCALNTIDSIIKSSIVANRREEFNKMLFVASSCPAFVSNFETIVTVYNENGANKNN